MFVSLCGKLHFKHCEEGKKLHPDFICTFVLKKFLNTAILLYGLVSPLFIPKSSPFLLGLWQLTAISLHMGKGLDVETKDKSGRVKMCITQMHGFFHLSTFASWSFVFFSSKAARNSSGFTTLRIATPWAPHLFVSILISRSYAPHCVTRKGREGKVAWTHSARTSTLMVIQGPAQGSCQSPTAGKAFI